MWFDPATNTIVYPTHDPRLLQYCEGAVPLAPADHPPMIALPATIKNLQVARVLGYDVVRPLREYNWPRSPAIKTPFHAQTETANFLVTHPRAYVLSDMGCGKTLAALWAADALMNQEKFSALIMAPLSTLETVWKDATFANFLRRRKLVILHGTEQQRLAQLAQPADFYCINHDGIKVGARLTGDKRRPKVEFTPGGFAATLRNRKDIRMAIVDEAGAFRDHRSLRSRVARLLTAEMPYYWGMTGTPMPNGPLDAYGLAKLLNNSNGELWTNFRTRMMLQVNKFKWVPREGAMQAALAMLSPYIRFSIDDCQDLPDLAYQDRQVDLSADQRKRLKKIRNDYLMLMENGKEVSAVNEAALRSKMLQICQGIVYDDGHDGHDVDCADRMAALREIIDEAGAKVLVFAGFTASINRLNMGLKGVSHAVILGSTPPKERAAIIKAFQEKDDPRVILAHPDTIAEGQTLTAAAVTVWWGPIDKTNIYIQANKRMHRPGQTRPCTVVNLVGSTIEREVFRRLAERQSLQGAMLKLAEADI